MRGDLDIFYPEFPLVKGLTYSWPRPMRMLSELGGRSQSWTCALPHQGGDLESLLVAVRTVYKLFTEGFCIPAFVEARAVPNSLEA